MTLHPVNTVLMWAEYYIPVHRPLDDATSTSPVTTVPRPEIEKTSYTGIRNGRPRPLGLGNVGVQRIGS